MSQYSSYLQRNVISKPPPPFYCLGYSYLFFYVTRTFNKLDALFIVWSFQKLVFVNHSHNDLTATDNVRTESRHKPSVGCDIFLVMIVIEWMKDGYEGTIQPSMHNPAYRYLL